MVQLNCLLSDFWYSLYCVCGNFSNDFRVFGMFFLRAFDFIFGKMLDFAFSLCDFSFLLKTFSNASFRLVYLFKLNVKAQNWLGSWTVTNIYLVVFLTFDIRFIIKCFLCQQRHSGHAGWIQPGCYCNTSNWLLMWTERKVFDEMWHIV